MRALYARVFDVAGTIVGTVERVQLCRRKAQMRPGDVLIGSLQAGRTPMVIP
jgi:phosphoribosylaminoimidazole (AIR) synthetase